jgi:hypothetical protein
LHFIHNQTIARNYHIRRLYNNVSVAIKTGGINELLTGATEYHNMASKPSTRPCHHGKDCKRKDTCKFDHSGPAQVQVCRYGAACRNKDCRFPHLEPKTEDNEKSAISWVGHDCKHFDGRTASCRRGLDCLKLHVAKGNRRLCFAHCLNGKCDKASHPGFEHPPGVKDLLSFGDRTYLSLVQHLAEIRVKYGKRSDSSDEAADE